MSPSGAIREFAWDEIVRIRYLSYQFEITLTSGVAVAIPAFMRGIPEFAEMVFAKVPAARIDAKTQKALRRFAAATGEDEGELPAGNARLLDKL